MRWKQKMDFGHKGSREDLFASAPLLGGGKTRTRAGHSGIALLKSTLTWILFHLTETWRVVVSCVLSLVIYVLYSLPFVPNFVVCIVVALLLCLFGQYEIVVKKREKKE